MPKIAPAIGFCTAASTRARRAGRSGANSRANASGSITNPLVLRFVELALATAKANPSLLRVIEKPG